MVLARGEFMSGSDGPQVSGSRVRALREALGLSRAAMAKRSGVSRVTSLSLEKAEQTRVRQETLEGLLSVFDVDVEDLTASGRPIEVVAREVWRRAGSMGRMPLERGVLRPGAALEGTQVNVVAVRRGGRIVEWRGSVDVPLTALAAAQEPGGLYVEEAFTFDGEALRPGDVIVLDYAQPWTSGEFCLFRQDLRFVWARCTLEGNDVVWLSDDGVSHRAAQRTLLLVGVFVGVQPGFRPKS